MYTLVMFDVRIQLQSQKKFKVKKYLKLNAGHTD